MSKKKQLTNEEINFDNRLLINRFEYEIEKLKNIEYEIKYEFNADMWVFAIIPSIIECFILANKITRVESFYFFVGFASVIIGVCAINYIILGWLFCKKRIVKIEKFGFI